MADPKPVKIETGQGWIRKIDGLRAVVQKVATREFARAIRFVHYVFPTKPRLSVGRDGAVQREWILMESVFRGRFEPEEIPKPKVRKPAKAAPSRTRKPAASSRPLRTHFIRNAVDKLAICRKTLTTSAAKYVLTTQQTKVSCPRCLRMIRKPAAAVKVVKPAKEIRETCGAKCPQHGDQKGGTCAVVGSDGAGLDADGRALIAKVLAPSPTLAEHKKADTSHLCLADPTKPHSWGERTRAAKAVAR